MFTDFRLRIRHFFKKYGKVLGIAFLIWLVIFIVNRIIANYEPKQELQTTYTPHTSVMDDSSSVSKSISDPIEEMIEQYVTFCNDADWQAAYNMLSDECKRYSFNDNIEEFMEYVYTKMPTPKKYAIQDYSNKGNTYIYQIKYTDDMLATGLTNTTYNYTEEKMTFKKQSDGTIEMSVGNYLEHNEIKNISESEYLKVDVKSVTKYYSIEEYEVKLTNRSQYTIVIADGQEEKEIVLKLNSGDTRKADLEKLVLAPGYSTTVMLKFPKLYDNNDDAKSLVLNTVRVMEKYSGANVDEATAQAEIQNAIAKFGVSIPVDEEE